MIGLPNEKENFSDCSVYFCRAERHPLPLLIDLASVVYFRNNKLFDEVYDYAILFGRVFVVNGL